LKGESAMKLLKLPEQNIVLAVGCYKAEHPEKIQKDELLSWLASKHNYAQVVRGDLIVSYFQAFHALYQAYLASKRKLNISRSFALEILLRISATRQIDDALDFAGLRNNQRLLCLLALDSDEQKLRDLEKEFIEKYSLKETTPKPDLKLVKELYGCKIEPCIVSKISLVNLETNVRRS
jgi:tRNA threonylcarbamoyladenosine modification (KEOPS) complex Cgi121 subunit